MSYGERLRYFRKKSHLTIGEAAKLINISEKSLSMYELDKQKLPISVFIKLSKLYGFDVYDVFRVHAPSELEEDIPAYNIITAHCDYIISKRIKADKEFGNEFSEEFYDQEYKELIEEFTSDEFYAEQFPGLDKSVVPDKYFR